MLREEEDWFDKADFGEGVTDDTRPPIVEGWFLI